MSRYFHITLQVNMMRSHWFKWEVNKTISLVMRISCRSKLNYVCISQLIYNIHEVSSEYILFLYVEDNDKLLSRDYVRHKPVCSLKRVYGHYGVGRYDLLTSTSPNKRDRVVEIAWDIDWLIDWLTKYNFFKRSSYNGFQKYTLH